MTNGLSEEIDWGENKPFIPCDFVKAGGVHVAFCDCKKA